MAGDGISRLPSAVYGMQMHSLSLGWPRSIATRLNCIVAIALMAVTILTVASLHFSRTAVEAAAALKEAGVVGLVNVLEFDTLLERHQRLVETAVRDATADQPLGLRQQLDRLQRRMSVNLTQRVTHGRDEILAALPDLDAAARAVLESARTGSNETTALLAAYRKVSLALHALIGTERRDTVARMSERVERLSSTALRLADWVGVSAIVALVLIGPVSLLLLRRVTHRLQIITRSMLHLSHNDLDAPTAARQLAKADGPDEIGDMARALAVFRSNALALRDHRGRLEQVNLWLDVALNNMQRGLAMFDTEERLVISNANYQRMYDLRPDLTMYGTPLADILAHGAGSSVADPTAVIADYRAAVAANRTASYVRSLTDGRSFCVVLTPLVAGGWVTTHEDVTQKQQTEARMQLLARQDALTELQNRRGFGECLEALVTAIPIGGDLARSHSEFAVIAIDLDHFKEINDTHGHPVGDALLVAVSERLRGATRKNDIVARMGGDEFAILQRDIRDVSDVEGFAQRLLPLLAEPYEVRGHTLVIGASLGVAMAPAHGRTPELLMQRADVALYRAKAAGRNTAVTFEEILEAPIRARREMERDLRAAIAAGDLALHFQPILDLRARAVVSCEALLRWQRADGGFVPPIEFVKLAEETGLIEPLGVWALREACRVAASWPQTIKVAVNLSPLQFIGGRLLSQVQEALALANLSAHQLELEITESTLLTDNATTLATLHELRALGVAIALDDFGTGYSSLSYLRAFPFDKLKIDRSFVRDLSDREDCLAIVKAVATLAESLNMTTVAEGVETHDHLMRVHLAGCTAVQGYLFSRPVPAHELSQVFDVCTRQLAA